MTEQEFRKFIEDQHGEGRSDEDIVKIFAKMFQDGKSDRDEFEALIGALGYELSEDLRGLSDDELREKVVEEKDPKGGAKKADTIDPDGDEPKKADPAKGGSEPDSDEDGGEKRSPADEDDGEDEDEDEDEDEKKKAMGLFGLKD